MRAREANFRARGVRHEYRFIVYYTYTSCYTMYMAIVIFSGSDVWYVTTEAIYTNDAARQVKSLELKK